MGTNPVVLEKALRAEYMRQQIAFQQASGAAADLMNLAMPVPSTHKSEKYGWLAQQAGVREWVGEKRYSELKDYSYEILNRDFELSIAIDRNDIDDDTIGAHMLQVKDLVDKMRRYPRTMISDLILNGTTGLAYDGSAFFADRTSPNDNLLAGTGVTLALLDADLTSVEQAMAKFTGPDGEVLNLAPNVIVCPVALKNKFLRLVNSKADPTATAGTDTFNPYAGNYIVIADARLDGTDTGDWYAFCTTGVLKPFVLQTRKPPEPVFDDTKVKQNRMYYFGSEMRANAGYGFYQFAIKVVNT